MISKKLSLSIAKQVRLCPPSAIEMDPAHGKQVERHRAICPYCSDAQVADISPWDGLAEKIQSLGENQDPVSHRKKSSSRSPAAYSLSEGNICVVRQELGIWRDGYFYNPPAVLIIEKTSAVSDDVLVVQIYHDSLLAGPGDLILETDQSPVGVIFIETWNTYTLRSRDLMPAVGKVDEGVLSAVKTLAADPAAYPGWAVIPGPMEDDDPRIYFREMEVEVGYTFSSSAVSGLMGELEGPSLRLVYSTPKEAMADIKNKNPDIEWPLEPGSINQALATAQFPPERYAMAAALTDQEHFKANLVTVRSGRVEAIEPVEGEILQRKAEPEGIVIGGGILLPHGSEISEVLCFVRTEEGHFISSETPDQDPKGTFLARFQVSPQLAGDLFVAAIREVPGD